MRKRRLVLKFGGEFFCGVGPGAIRPFNPQAVAFLVRQIVMVLQVFWDWGIEILIVVGGGNVFRGSELKKSLPQTPRAHAHIMGMNNTGNNGYVLEQALLADPWIKEKRIEIRLVNSLQGGQIGEAYILKKVEHHLENKQIVVSVGGTGKPYFTTDTGAVIDGLSVEASVIYKCTKHAVYDKDPAAHSDAKMISRQTFEEYRDRDLQILDPQAIGTLLTVPKEERPAIAVLNAFEDGALLAALQGANENVSYICEPNWKLDLLS